MKGEGKMDEKFNITDLEAAFPSVVIEKDGEKEIDYKALSLILAEEVSDIKDQLLDKDYQITKIFERIERLSKMI